jgi:hypothetical protein
MIRRFLLSLLVLPLLGQTVIYAAQSSLSNYVTMQIVAHEDDDILFMNPDLRNMGLQPQVPENLR